MHGVQLKANSHIPRGVALIHTHMPCCASAMLLHCRVLRESPLGSRKTPKMLVQ